MKKNQFVAECLFCGLCVACVFALFSCKSVPVVEEEKFIEASSLEDLIGVWNSEKGEYEYPFVMGNKKYIRIAAAKTDDTEIWQNYADAHGMNLEYLWQRRFSYLQKVYVPDGYIDRIPVSDSHGTEYGRKLFIENGRIFSRVEMIIPEKILITNLRFFLISEDKSKFTEQNTFFLASDIFTDLTADGTLYKKIINEEIDSAKLAPETEKSGSATEVGGAKND